MPFIAGIHYFEHIDKNISRPPLILLHGAGGLHLSWSPHTRRIAQTHIYALDLPGHGKSTGMGSDSIEEYADDVLQFMNALELESAVIAGHSMGSAIALTLALKGPRRVMGLVLIGSGAKLRVAPAILEGVSKPEAFLATVQLINDNSFRESVDPRLKQLSTQRMAQTYPPVLHNDFLACNAFDVTGQLGAIDIPVLIICGSQDKMTPPRFSHSLQEGIANSRLEIVEGAGHMTMLEDPQLVTELIARFLDEFPPPAR